MSTAYYNVSSAPMGADPDLVPLPTFSLESILHSLVFLAEVSSKTSFKKEYLVCMGSNNLKLICYITRVDFESLTSKTFQHLPFTKATLK